MPPLEIANTQAWNTSLRTATSTGETVIVDFHADWCGPCKTIAPKYTALADANPHIRFLRVNVDKQTSIASKYQCVCWFLKITKMLTSVYRIKSMPTFLAIKKGKVVEQVCDCNHRNEIALNRPPVLRS